MPVVSFGRPIRNSRENRVGSWLSRGWSRAPGDQFRYRVASFVLVDSYPVALPREGVLVADLTQNVAGPFCTQILGDMGAEVVKVERPGRGDDARAWAPPWWGGESAAFMAMNRNKKSLALDLKKDGGLEVLRRLVARADVFVQSLRAGAVAELGVDFAGATRLNPRLVYCSITAYGARGPLADLPGYDPLLQAYGGLMSVHRPCEGLAAPALAHDARFADNPARVRNRAALGEALAALTRGLKTAELLERLRAAGVPAAPILTIDAVVKEPQTRASGMLVQAPHPRIPGDRSVGLHLLWAGVSPEVRRVPPHLAEQC